MHEINNIGPARQAVVPIDRSISAQKERARQILLSLFALYMYIDIQVHIVCI